MAKFIIQSRLTGLYLHTDGKVRSGRENLLVVPSKDVAHEQLIKFNLDPADYELHSH